MHRIPGIIILIVIFFPSPATGQDRSDSLITYQRVDLSREEIRYNVSLFIQAPVRQR